MIFISHRGNIAGPNPKDENKIEYINNAIELGFNVEIDVWFYKNNFYLGHDNPEYKINKNFLLNKKLWCHAKNFDSLVNLKKIKAHFFWHQEDDFVLTSKGFIWTYPGKKLNNKSICVLPEKTKKFDHSKDYAGICSDFIHKYKKKIRSLSKKT